MQNRRSAIIKKIIPSSAAEVQVDRKRYLVSLFLALGTIILLSFGIEDIVRANYLEGSLESVLGVSFGLVVLFLSRSANNLWLYRLCTAAMTALFIFLILHETGPKLIMLWTLLLPPIVFYVLGKKEGLVWATAISGLVFVAVIVNPVFSGQRLYNTPMLSRFFSLYIVTALMSWVFEYLRNEYQDAAEGERRELSIEQKRLSEAYDKIKELSITDPLTGAYNRAFLTDRLPVEIRRAARYQHDLSVSIIDVDYFKRINDTHGHSVGDQVLKDLVRVIDETVRSGIDWVCRFGGEEFVVVMPETGEEGAAIAGERIRAAVESHQFVFGRDEVPVTVSLGVAGGNEVEDLKEDVEIVMAQLIELADVKLYLAKKMGRNRVITSTATA